MAEIKPCPFCGEDAEMKESRNCRPIEGWLSYTIACKGCGCEMLGETINPYREKSEKAKKSVIAKWNKRVKEGEQKEGEAE